MITAQLATIPQRESSLRLTIASLEKQVDHLSIRNGDLRISGVMGDAEKFADVESYNGYFFTCDDDLIYPPDYVQYMISKIEQYERKAVITLHGRNYEPGKIKRYYGGNDREKKRDKDGNIMYDENGFPITISYHCMQRVVGDHQVMVGGTGVMAFHTDTVKVKYEDFKLPNMADLWMAIVCKNQNVPIMVVEHLPNWLQVGYDGEDTIWNKHFNDDSVQTAIYNKYMI